MRLFTPTRVTSALVVMLLLGAQAAQAQSAQSVQPTAADLQAWQANIANVSRPQGNGCFTSSYPLLAWQEATCAKPPAIPMVPKPGPRPFVIGNGNDISAQAPFGLISAASGSFENVMGVVSESSPIGGVGPPVANAYSLQLNTNFMASPACAGSPNPSCRGWEQFIFANDGTSGLVFIQYWLIQYNTTCRAGWFSFSFTPGGDIYCFQNSPAATATPNEPITNLANLRLQGDAAPLGDNAVFFAGASAYAAPGSNAVSASAGWTIAEFNVFGYGGGGEAAFNPGASVNVRTRINYGGVTQPNCVAQGFTGETNNLNFGTPAPPATPPMPSVIFLENTIGGAVANCSAASVIGDTHQSTFGGTAYDFQATGDFQEALVGSNFEVQTRKVSGAPTWPGTSVNQSAATRMGTTKVAVCEGKRLVVDGRTAELQSGGVLALPTGVTIRRIGNTYTVTDDSGNSMTVTIMSGYLNVEVGLGTWPATVRGLLGNPDNNPNLLEAKNGTRISAPFNFDELYRVFGDSWRVSPLRTLLSPCDQVAAGNPAAPFYAKDLNPDLHQRAQGICMQVKVAQAWLNNCILDVAVIGDNAAQVYVNMAPPEVNGNP